MFTHLYEQYDCVFQEISNHFGCEKSNIRIKKQFNEGKSGDTVLLIRVINPSSVSNTGEYVLKLFNGEKSALTESINTFSANSSAEYEHISIPKIRIAEKNYYVYDVAGEELLQASSLAKMEERSRSSRLGKISKHLLFEWNNSITSKESSLYEIIYDWLDYRLNTNSRLVERVKFQITDELTESFNYDNHTYPNPIYYLSSNTSPLNTSEKILALYGQTHGDLNLNNVIAQKMSDNSYKFFLIDFEQYNPFSPLLFDQAYLLLCSLLETSKALTLVEWKKVIETMFVSMGGEMKISQEFSNKTPYLCITSQIDALKEFEVRQQSHNRKSFRMQLLAAHVAAGLNFVNKSSSDDRQQKMSLLYAAAAMEELLKQLDINISNNNNSPSLQTEHVNSSELWTMIERFSTDNRYILITSGNENYVPYAQLSCLAPIKWSSIIEINSIINNPLRDQILPIYKRTQGYRFYNISSQYPENIESSPAWVQIFVPSEKRNPGIYYRSNVQNTFCRIMQKLLSDRQNENLYIIADLQGIDEKIYNNVIQDILTQAGENTLTHIITLNGISVEVDSEDLIKNVVTSYSLQDLAETVYSLRDNNHIYSEPKIPSINGMVPISPETVANLANDMDLIYQNMLYDMSDDDGDNFYHGGPATWCDIAYERDVSRLHYSSYWKSQINLKLEQMSFGAGTIINLYHKAGGGGTTLSKRIAWDFCSTYPTVILRKYSNMTVDRLKSLYSISKKTLLVIAEMSDGQISFDTISMLRRELMGKNVRILFLCVSRCSNRGQSVDGTLYLPDTANLCMSQDESIKMLRHYTERLNNSYRNENNQEEKDRRINDLNALTYNDIYEDIRQPFFYGLYAYKNDFNGVKEYVQKNCDGINDNIKNTLNILAIITLYSHSISLSFEETALFLFPDKIPNQATELVKDWMYSNALVVRQERGMRICHPIIAEEILKQNDLLQTSDTGNTGTKALNDLILKFIDCLKVYYGENSKRMDLIFREIFTHRDMIYEKEPMKFSQLLTAFNTREQCVSLMEYVSKTIPENPHYSNHLARLYLYPITQEQSGFKADPDKALPYALEAIEKSENDVKYTSVIHYHVLGKVYTKKCISLLDGMKRNKSVSQMLLSIKPTYNKACEAFDMCISQDNSGYGITGKLELISSVLNKIVQKKHTSFTTMVTQQNQGNEELITNMLAEAGDLINKYSFLFDITSVPFRSACITFYKTIGNTESIETILRANATTLEERAYANRAISTTHMKKASKDGRFSYDYLSERELRTIFKLMQNNVNSFSENEQDRIRWFETYRRLSDFDLMEAYRFLEEWPNAEKSIFVCYYRYVIAFLLYNINGSVSYSTVTTHMRQCINLSRNVYGKNTTMSTNFYGNADDTLLLPWKEHYDDFKESRTDKNKSYRDNSCKKFQGKIDSIANNIVTIRFWCDDDGNHSFLASMPNIDQISLEKEGYLVSFHLGFSYSGMRAWDIELESSSNSESMKESLENLINMQ